MAGGRALIGCQREKTTVTIEQANNDKALGGEEP